MPFMIARVNVPVSREQELTLKAHLGKAIELVPGKSEASLLLGIEDNWHLYLRGDDCQPVAYIQVSVFGNELHHGYHELTASITRSFHRVLGIAPECVYVKYEDISVWGVGGMTFDRSQYR